MRVGVLYSPFDKLANKEVEQDLKEMGLSVHDALKGAGYDPLLIDIDKTDFSRIQELDLDLLFNVCERLHGDCMYEPQIASLLEMMSVRITGSSGSTLSVCNNKIMMKEMARHHGILTPRSQVLFAPDQVQQNMLKFPVIIKPASMHNSIGIFKDSLAHDEEDMRKKAARIMYQYRQPALIEEYIPGKDVEVSIMGNSDSMKTLPPIEVHYPRQKDQSSQFFSYESKWSSNKKESGCYRRAQGIEPKITAKIVRLARKCYRLYGLRDYGRGDFRLGNDGKVYLLEVNANPGLSPGDSLIVAGGCDGMTHAKIIIGIFLNAAKRNSLVNGQQNNQILQKTITHA